MQEHHKNNNLAPEMEAKFPSLVDNLPEWGGNLIDVEHKSAGLFGILTTKTKSE